MTAEWRKRVERLFLGVQVEYALRRMPPHYVKPSLAAKLKTANSAIEKVIAIK